MQPHTDIILIHPFSRSELPARPVARDPNGTAGRLADNWISMVSVASEPARALKDELIDQDDFERLLNRRCRAGRQRAGACAPQKRPRSGMRTWRFVTKASSLQTSCGSWARLCAGIYR
jgi:hypothetical protein